MLCRYVLMRVPKLKQPEERTIPAWVLIQSKSDEDGDLDQFNKIAYDILLPLPKEFLQGGQIAAESIGLQLLQAVRPYRKAGAPPRAPHECFSLMRCFAQGGSPWLRIGTVPHKLCQPSRQPAC